MGGWGGCWALHGRHLSLRVYDGGRRGEDSHLSFARSCPGTPRCQFILPLHPVGAGPGLQHLNECMPEGLPISHPSLFPPSPPGDCTFCKVQISLIQFAFFLALHFFWPLCQQGGGQEVAVSFSSPLGAQTLARLLICSRMRR